MNHVQQIREASARISSFIIETDCVQLPGEVLAKREDEQVSGSFKIRGVLNQVLSADEKSVRRGIVCVSSGNTGRALCHVAAMLNTSAHVFVPKRFDPAKKAVLEDAGATVVGVGSTFGASAQAAQDFATRTGMVFCSPGASWPFIYGVGTVYTEIRRQTDAANIYVPVGGGGLAAGMGLAAGSRRTAVPRLIGVELESSPFVAEILRYGRMISTMAGPSLADCLTGDLEDAAIIKDVAGTVLHDVLLVTDEDLLVAQKLLLKSNISVELGAAAGYAGHRMRSHEGPTCVVLTGKGWAPSSQRSFLM